MLRKDRILPPQPAGQPFHESDAFVIVAHGLLANAIPTQVVTVDSDFEYFQGRFVIVNSHTNASFARLAEEMIAYSISLR